MLGYKICNAAYEGYAHCADVTLLQALYLETFVRCNILLIILHKIGMYL